MGDRCNDRITNDNCINSTDCNATLGMLYGTYPGNMWYICPGGIVLARASHIVIGYYTIHDAIMSMNLFISGSDAQNACSALESVAGLSTIALIGHTVLFVV